MIRRVTEISALNDSATGTAVNVMNFASLDNETCEKEAVQPQHMHNHSAIQRNVILKLKDTIRAM